MSNLIYIKVHKGYVEARTHGEHNESRFYSKGLSHPRTLAGDFVEVEKTFKEALSAQPKKWFGLIVPNVLIHLIPEAESGYTSTEIRFFEEVAFGAGARKVDLISDKCSPLNETFKSL